MSFQHHEDFGSAVGSIHRDSQTESQQTTHEFFIKQDSEKQDHKRKQEAKDLISSVFQGLVRAFSNIVFVIAVAVAWHFVLPETLSWLSDDELKPLLQFLLSSLVIGSVSTYIRQHI